jgi:HEAT repeat protein
MLTFIWIVSSVLAMASLVVMLVLVVVRFFSERGAARRARQRERLQAALIQFTADDDEEALSACISATQPNVAVDVSFEFLDLLRGEERTRIEAILDRKGIPSHVRKVLRSGNDAQRLHAAEIATAFPAPKTLEALRRAMSDRAREVRIAAAISLAHLGALPDLDTTLRKIGPRGQRSRRLIELFQVVASSRTAELKGLAADLSAPSFVRAAAVDALSLSGDYQLIPFLEEMASCVFPEIAASAIRALGRYAHPASAQRLLAALESKDWEVRAEAAEAIGRVGISDAAEPLAALMNDDEWTVRYAAAKTLKGMGDQGTAMLRRLADQTGARGQRTASMVLIEGPVK